jgi:threonyl-tRNA synthetase
MFVLDEDGRGAALKPVSCPGHIQIVERMAPSYRDLPLKIAELGLVHRNEVSGALHGLFRLRQFTQDDGHIFCSEDQIEEQIGKIIFSLLEIYRKCGFENIEVSFSSRPAVRVGSNELWDRAEQILERAARNAGIDFGINPGQGAFYGPKLELALRDRLGREWQCGTVQLDFNLPERFGMSYVSSSGAKVRPAMIHRAIFGSLERFLGILLEHHRGALPAWIAPEQVLLAPISEAEHEYAKRCFAELQARGVRVVLDVRSESLGKKIAEAREAGIPYVAVAGAREMERNILMLRARDGSNREVSAEEINILLGGG